MRQYQRVINLTQLGEIFSGIDLFFEFRDDDLADDLDAELVGIFVLSYDGRPFPCTEWYRVTRTRDEGRRRRNDPTINLVPRPSSLVS